MTSPKPESESEPSHIMEGDYAILMETNGKEYESWYYFIRVEGNEEALKHLQKQLESVEWTILDDLSTFDLELEHYVSARTAKEMTKVDLNATSFHRKFDGKLDMIHLGFKDKDDDETRMCKAFDHLSYGQIEDYIDDEDLDEEDLVDVDSEDESDESSSEEEESSSEEEGENKEAERRKGIPPALLNSSVPRWARGKRKGK